MQDGSMLKDAYAGFTVLTTPPRLMVVGAEGSVGDRAVKRAEPHGAGDEGAAAEAPTASVSASSILVG